MITWDVSRFLCDVTIGTASIEDPPPPPQHQAVNPLVSPGVTCCLSAPVFAPQTLWCVSLPCLHAAGSGVQEPRTRRSVPGKVCVRDA